MIAFLHGILVQKDVDTVAIDVQGVGYQVHITQHTRSMLPETGAKLFLHTALEVREDSMTLYGFSSQDEGDTFRLLRNVSGIGPKTALGILSGIKPGELRQAILFEDAARLSQLPGVGKKTAQRLILELKDKMKLAADIGSSTSVLGSGDVQGGFGEDYGGAFMQAREALLELGYSAAEIQEALHQIERQSQKDGKQETVGNSGQSPSAEQLIRQALKLLARDSY